MDKNLRLDPDSHANSILRNLEKKTSENGFNPESCPSTKNVSCCDDHSFYELSMNQVWKDVMFYLVRCFSLQSMCLCLSNRAWNHCEFISQLVGSMYGIHIYIYIYHNIQSNVGKCTSPMDPMRMLLKDIHWKTHPNLPEKKSLSGGNHFRF